MDGVMSLSYWKRVVIQCFYNPEKISEHYKNLIINNPDSEELNKLISEGILEKYLNSMDRDLFSKCIPYLLI